MTEQFTLPGTYALHLDATNGLGSLSSGLTIVAQYQIIAVSVKVPTVIEEEVSILQLEIHGGQHITLMVNFGDGSDQLTLSTENRTLDLQELAPLASGVPRYSCTLEHQYEAVGLYLVELTASNLVSSLWTSEYACVEQAITGISVVSTSGIAIPELEDRALVRGEPAVVSVMVTTGNNLTFDWDFDDYLPLNTKVER